VMHALRIRTAMSLPRDHRLKLRGCPSLAEHGGDPTHRAKIKSELQDDL
jgi:hypothetical protein